MIKKPAFWLLAALMVFQTGFWGTGQASPLQKKTQNELQQEVTVTYKLIQAYVTDKKGNPVTDLTAADFEVYDNNVLKQITQFEIHQLDTTPTTAPAPEAKVELAVEPLPPARQYNPMHRKFFFVFNFAMIEPAGIGKARETALYFMDNHVSPTDEIGIISFSALKGVTIHEYLTADHKRIRDMIASLGMKAYIGRAEQLTGMYAGNVLQYIDQAPEDYQRDIRPSVFWSLEEAKARISNYNQNAALFMSAMKILARGLRLIPGYKNIVFFSTGIAGFSMYGSLNVNLPENLGTVDSQIEWSNAMEVKFGSSSLREAYQGMIDEMKAANCPVYSVNVSGAQFTNDVDQVGGIDMAESMRGENRSIRTRDLTGNDSLRELSSKTGGKYFDNSMDLREAAQQIQKVTSTYYVLGFSIPGEWDGKFHKIKIKVKRKGCEVYGEGGYFNPKPFAQYTEFEKFVHILDLAAGDQPHLLEPIGFSLSALPILQKDKMPVSLFSRMPKEKFAGLAPGKTEVVTILFGDANRVSVFKRNPLFIQALTEDSVFHDQVEVLKPGRYECRLVVRNLETGRGTSASATVVVPDRAAAASPGITLYPAGLFATGNKARYQGDVNALNSMYPFDITPYMPVVKEIEKGRSLLIAVVPCALAGIPEPEITLTGSLLNTQTKQSVPVELKIQDSYKTEAIQTYLVEIGLGELEPGSYTLLISAEEKKTGAKSQAATNFVVR